MKMISNADLTDAADVMLFGRSAIAKYVWAILWKREYEKIGNKILYHIINNSSNRKQEQEMIFKSNEVFSILGMMLIWRNEVDGRMNFNVWLNL